MFLLHQKKGVELDLGFPLFLSVWEDTSYIKPECSITLCIMDKHQAQLQEALVGDKMGHRKAAGDLEAPHGPRRPSKCFKCVVALTVVMGLITVALVSGFIYFILTSTSNQVRNNLALAENV